MVTTLRASEYGCYRTTTSALITLEILKDTISQRTLEFSRYPCNIVTQFLNLPQRIVQTSQPFWHLYHQLPREQPEASVPAVVLQPSQPYFSHHRTTLPPVPGALVASGVVVHPGRRLQA